MKRQPVIIFILMCVIATLIAVLITVTSTRNQATPKTIKEIVSVEVLIPADTVFMPADTIKVIVPQYITLPPKEIIDTAKNCCEKFYSKYSYNDTIHSNDATLVIYEDISENLIFNRVVSIKNLRETKTITRKILPQPKSNFFIGGALTLSPDRLGYQISGWYKTKTDVLYGVSYDPPNKQIEFHIAKKLW